MSPTQMLDIGARFFLDGYVAQSGGNGNGAPNYFDLRALMFSVRVHV